MSDFKITDKSGIKLKTANKYVREDLTVTLTDDDINNIVAENIRKGKTILNISGSLEEGIDTSDATAVPSDILVGKTAYVNNEKIEGTMSEYDGTFENGEDNAIEDRLITREISDNYSNDRVASIGKYAFAECKSLTSVNFPNVTSIGNNAFAGCSNLTSVSFPQVTGIGEYVFEYCSKLANVSLPQITSIGIGAFSNCFYLTDISFPQVTSIEAGAFMGCSRLVSVNFPSVTSIRHNVFVDCRELTDVNIPNVTSIGEYAFQSCSKLTSVSFPNATSISYYAFTECKSLTSVNIPNLTSIGNFAFNSCYSLTKLVITQTTKVCTLSKTNAFNKCYHFLGTVNSTYNPNGDKDGRIYVPDNLVASYKSAPNWSEFADIIVGLSELPAEE